MNTFAATEGMRLPWTAEKDTTAETVAEPQTVTLGTNVLALARRVRFILTPDALRSDAPEHMVRATEEQYDVFLGNLALEYGEAVEGEVNDGNNFGTGVMRLFRKYAAHPVYIETRPFVPAIENPVLEA